MTGSYTYPSLQNVNANKIYNTMAGSLVDFSSATVPPSVITGLVAVATGGSIDNSLVTGLAAVATGGSINNSLVTGLAAVATGGSIDNSLVTGLAAVATGGSIDTSLVTGLDGFISGYGYATTVYVNGAVSGLASTSDVSTSISTALNDYTTTSGLEPVATGGTLDASLISVANGYIQGSQLQPSTITPGTFYICKNAPGNFAVTHKIEGSVNPLEMAKAIAQCVKFANDAAEYYNKNSDSPCTAVVSNPADAYIFCLETIVGVDSIPYTIHTPT